MHRFYIFLCICTTGMIHCADPYAQIKMELGASMSPLLVEALIQEDERARRALPPERQLTDIPSPQSSLQPVTSKTMTPEERKAFQERMALRARNAKFGNLGV